MGNMFNGCNKLAEIKLSVNFSFKGKNITSSRNQAILPTPPTSTTTGKWIREDEVYGPFTPEELRDNYNSSMAGTWIWQEKPTKYTIRFIVPEGASGSMAPQKILATESATITPNAFIRFNYHFKYWEGDDGNTYTDGQTIPANTFAAGSTLTLTAVMEKDDNSLNLSSGEGEIILHSRD